MNSFAFLDELMASFQQYVWLQSIVYKGSIESTKMKLSKVLKAFGVDATKKLFRQSVSPELDFIKSTCYTWKYRLIKERHRNENLRETNSFRF